MLTANIVHKIAARKKAKKATPSVGGRKLEPGTGTVFKRTVTVDNDTWEKIKALGEGDFSRGIRNAARNLASPSVTPRKKTVTYDDDVSDLL